MTPTQIVSRAWYRVATSPHPTPTMQTLLREIVNGDLIPEGADDVFEAAVIRECKERTRVPVH